MGVPRARPSFVRYLVVGGLVALCAMASWIVADAAATRAHMELVARNRGLQVELARSAMEEGFVRLLEGNRILANYSFPEYLRGVRTAASMIALFASERASYRESIIYAFYEKPGSPRFRDGRAEAEAVAAELDARSKEAWERLTAFEGPLVFTGSGFEPEPYFLLYLPVRLDGELRGLLGTAVGFGKAIAKYVLPLGRVEGRRGYLLSGEERVLWPPKGALPAAGEGDLVTRRAFRLGTEVFFIVGYDEKASLLAEMRSIDAPRRFVLASGLMLAALAVLGALSLYRAELRRLAAAEEGRRLAEAVAERERALAASDLRYEALFDASTDGILLLDRQARVRRCNARAAELFGMSPEELCSKSIHDLSPPCQPPDKLAPDQARAIYAAAFAGEEQRFEWVHRRKDGGEFTVEAGLRLVHGVGERLVQARLHDITERKRTEAELRRALDDRELLLHELHHRVKNNLQFIDSLIELQKDSGRQEDRPALAKAQSRVSALAAAYLVAADTAETLHVETEGYFAAIASLARDGAELEDTRFEVRLEVESIPLSLDAAVPLGLILRELLVNAAEHGYGPGTKGVAYVRFVREGAEALLEVRDEGKGPGADLEEGLGLSIVRALVRQLHGTLAFEGAAPGFVARARFPLA